MCNITLRRVHATIAAVEMCVFVALGIQHAMHKCSSHLWPALLYRIFSYHLTNGTIFEKTPLNIKCVFQFHLQLLSETLFILERME
jgi:hypothetical protein